MRRNTTIDSVSEAVGVSFDQLSYNPQLSAVNRMVRHQFEKALEPLALVAIV